MLKLEEYIEKRKNEDGMNEFDSSQKTNNIRTCIDYIFEYFEQYLPMQGVEKRSVAENEKLHKYEKSISDYSEEIKQWLISIYETYEKRANRIIANYITANEDFYLLSEEAEFRSLSYDCYADLVKKNKFLKNQTEMLYHFIREYHIIETEKNRENIPAISEKITLWLKKTLEKYNVSIEVAIEKYIEDFYDNEGSWPAKSKMKAEYPYLDHKFDYNYKTKTNLFNVNTFYAKYANKPFIKGKKKEIEILMMHWWLHGMVEDEEYWNEYLLQYDSY